MPLQTDLFTGALGTIVLLLLSIYTIGRCKEDTKDHLDDPVRFLFEGKTRRYSLASSIGSVFSPTYFFGATFIYGHIYGLWLLVILAGIFAVVALLLPRVLLAAERELGAPSDGAAHRNLLLSLMKARLSPMDMRRLTTIYSLIYFGLLAEELAVSRLIIYTLFPFHPVMTTVLLSTICFVILAFLYYGGFRAALISDYEQAKVLLPFASILVFLIVCQSGPGESGRLFDTIKSPIHPGAALSGILFGASWFTASVDFYSRLNFAATAVGPRARLRERHHFALLSLFMTFLFLAVGIVFGVHLSTVFPRIDSPSTYTQQALAYFVQNGSRLLAVIFLVGMFCMIFTTINTLLLTLLQIGAYEKRSLFTRETLFRILLSALLCSVLLYFDSVSAVGMFVAALLVLPLLVIMQVVVWPHLRFWPKDLRYLAWSLPLATGVFLLAYSAFELRFERHFALAPLVLGCALFCMMLARMLDGLGSRRRTR